jgi:hypothetical protein
MTESLTTLRNGLSELRDASRLGFFAAAEAAHSEVIHDPYSSKAVWGTLDETLHEVADYLRGELRPLMVKITNTLRGSPLITDADLRDLGKQTKKMAAALRFSGFRQ